MTLFSDCQKLRQTTSHLRCSKLASSLDLWGLLAGLMPLSQPSCGWRLVLGQNSKSNQRGSESYYPPLLPLPKYIKKIITNRSFLPACAFLGASPASTWFAQTGELLLALSLLRLKTSRWYFFHFKTPRFDIRTCAGFELTLDLFESAQAASNIKAYRIKRIPRGTCKKH